MRDDPAWTEIVLVPMESCSVIFVGLHLSSQVCDQRNRPFSGKAIHHFDLKGTGDNLPWNPFTLNLWRAGAFASHQKKTGFLVISSITFGGLQHDFCFKPLATPWETQLPRGTCPREAFFWDLSARQRAHQGSEAPWRIDAWKMV